jgi:N-acylneuraminate-9-phosphatase
MKWKRMRYRNLAVPESTLGLLKKLRKQYQLALVTNGPSNSQWEKVSCTR